MFAAHALRRTAPAARAAPSPARHASTTATPVDTTPSSTSSTPAPRYVQLHHRRVSNTWNIPKKDLFLDMLFAAHGPLLEPVKAHVADRLFNSPLSRIYVTTNGHIRVSRPPTTVTDDLARFRALRSKSRHPNHHVFFSTTPLPAPASSSSSSSSIFTHSAVSGLPLENNALLNLPHSLLLSLRPFCCPTQPGAESYRDDRIVVRKLQIEQNDAAVATVATAAAKRAKRAKGAKDAKGARKNV